MDEASILELALKNCHKLERSLNETIKMVRRLNVRYNSDWLLTNYKNYVYSVWPSYGSKDDVDSVDVELSTPRKDSEVNLVLSARSSNELCGSNCKLNYKFIKIKRSMEALLLQMQRAIEIANRQHKFTHVNVLARDSRTRICCH